MNAHALIEAIPPDAPEGDELGFDPISYLKRGGDESATEVYSGPVVRIIIPHTTHTLNDYFPPDREWSENDFERIQLDGPFYVVWDHSKGEHGPDTLALQFETRSAWNGQYRGIEWTDIARALTPEAFADMQLGFISYFQQQIAQKQNARQAVANLVLLGRTDLAMNYSRYLGAAPLPTGKAIQTLLAQRRAGKRVRNKMARFMKDQRDVQFEEKGLYLLFDEWSDTSVFFSNEGRNNFKRTAAKVFGGEARDWFEADINPKDVWDHIDQRGLATIRQLLANREVMAENEDYDLVPTPITAEQIAELSDREIEDIVCGEHNRDDATEDIYRAIKYAASDAEADGHEAAYMQGYEGAVTDVLGPSSWIESKDSKGGVVHRLAFFISYDTLDSWLKQYAEDNYEDFDGQIHDLAQQCAKASPSEDYTGDFSEQYFHDQLEHQLSEISPTEPPEQQSELPLQSEPQPPAPGAAGPPQDNTRLETLVCEDEDEPVDPKEFLLRHTDLTPPAVESVHFSLTHEPEYHVDYRREFFHDDPETVAWIDEQLTMGNTWAWCQVEVTATWTDPYTGEEFEGHDYLGGCSYKSKVDFCEPGGYFDDMKSEAYDRLIKEIEKARGITESEQSKFHKPENFETVEEGSGWNLMAGANDWEVGHSAAAVLFPGRDGDCKRLWITIDHPEGNDHSTVRQADTDACKARGKKAVATWLKLARAAHGSKDYYDWYNCFEDVLTSAEMKPFISKHGADVTQWTGLKEDEEPVDAKAFILNRMKPHYWVLKMVMAHPFNPQGPGSTLYWNGYSWIQNFASAFKYYLSKQAEDTLEIVRQQEADSPHAASAQMSVEPYYGEQPRRTFEAEVLNEAIFKRSTTQIDLPDDIGQQIISWGELNIPEDALYIDEKDGCGRETEQHITVLYGLDAPQPPEALCEIVAKTKPFQIEMAGISIFENEKYDVVKIDVISEELTNLSNAIRAACPNQNKYDYHGHVTVAYVKKGLGAKLVGNDPFQEATVPRGFWAYELRFRGSGDSESAERVDQVLYFDKEGDPGHDEADVDDQKYPLAMAENENDSVDPKEMLLRPECQHYGVRVVCKSDGKVLYYRRGGQLGDFVSYPTRDTRLGPEEAHRAAEGISAQQIYASVEAMPWEWMNSYVPPRQQESEDDEIDPKAFMARHEPDGFMITRDGLFLNYRDGQPAWEQAQAGWPVWCLGRKGATRFETYEEAERIVKALGLETSVKKAEIVSAGMRPRTESEDEPVDAKAYLLSGGVFLLRYRNPKGGHPNPRKNTVYFYCEVADNAGELHVNWNEDESLAKRFYSLSQVRKLRRDFVKRDDGREDCYKVIPLQKPVREDEPVDVKAFLERMPPSGYIVGTGFDDSKNSTCYLSGTAHLPHMVVGQAKARVFESNDAAERFIEAYLRGTTIMGRKDFSVLPVYGLAESGPFDQPGLPGDTTSFLRKVRSKRRDKKQKQPVL